MTQDELRAAITALEDLPTPDREMDVRLADLLHPNWVRFPSIWDAHGWVMEVGGKYIPVSRYPGGDMNTTDRYVPRYTASLDEAIGLVGMILPGWLWRVASCHVSDDAWVAPDFNHPVHGLRLRGDFSEEFDWADATDIDLRPAGRPAIALIVSMLQALLLAKIFADRPAAQHKGQRGTHMAIEIIERGTLPKEKPYEVTCNNCRSHLRFLRGDAKFTDDQRDGAFLTITCPVCGDLVHRQA